MYLRKHLFNILAVIALLVLPILLISQAGFLLKWRFAAYNVYQNFSTTSSAEQKFDEIINYIPPPFNSTLDTNFWSVEDILHMLDVRNLFIVLYSIFFVSIFVTLALVIRYKEINIVSIRRLLGKFLIFLGAIAILSVFWWEQIFVLFHKIVFPGNEYWLLNPATSNLIKYFDNNTFFELFLLYLIALIFIFLCLSKYDILILWLKSQRLKKS